MRRLAAVAMALVALAACAKEDVPTPRASGKDPELIGPPAAQAPPILNFKADKLGGGQVVGSELVGRDVVVWFWAPW